MKWPTDVSSNLRIVIDGLRSRLVQAPKQARLFLILGPLFGVVFMVLSAPMQPADEPQHYWRAYQLSELQPLPEHFQDNRYGDVVPATVAGFARDSFAGKNPTARFSRATLSKYAHAPASGSPTPVYFENTAIYPPTSYLPQTVGIGLGRLLHLPVIYGFYGGRLLNLLTWTALVFCALYLIPFGRWSMLALGLMPMSVYQAASLSADAMLNGLAFVAVALFFYLYRQRHITGRQIAIAGVVLAALAAGKQTYGLLLLPYLLLPVRSFGSKQRYFRLIGLLVAAVSIITLAWSVLTLGVSGQIHAVLQPGEHIVPAQQVVHMLTHPFGFLGAVLYTLFLNSFNLILFGIIGIFGWLDIGILSFGYYIAIAIFLLAVLKDGAELPDMVLPALVRRLLYGVAGLTALLICAFLYIGYTAVGKGSVAGLQGRYFIPVLALLLPLLARRSFSIRVRERPFAILMCAALVLLLLSGAFALLDANFTRLLTATG